MQMKTDEKLVVRVAPMTAEDIPEIRELEQACFNATWPEESFVNELNNTRSAYYLTARHKGSLVGFVGSWLILDECHVTTIAVNPEFRGTGAGTLLLWCIFTKARERRSKWAAIEVSAKNPGARHLYEGFGFTQIGTRRSYYSPGEDAHVMWLKGIQRPEFLAVLDEKKKKWEEHICLSWE